MFKKLWNWYRVCTNTQYTSVLHFFRGLGTSFIIVFTLDSIYWLVCFLFQIHRTTFFTPFWTVATMVISIAATLVLDLVIKKWYPTKKNTK